MIICLGRLPLRQSQQLIVLELGIGHGFGAYTRRR